jgi:Bacterial RNA polymerase, alpha chain C terminal domain
MRNDVLNPCPTCGKQFDVGGCMTFVDYFLEKCFGGKCRVGGTQVVSQVPLDQQPPGWEETSDLIELRAVLLVDLNLSVRTTLSLDKLGIATVGDLLDTTEANIRNQVIMPEHVIEEIRRLLESKGLALRRT